MTHDEARVRAQDLADAPTGPVERPILLPGAIDRAGGLGHSIYDCFYLAAAVLRDTAAITADDRIAARVTAQAHLAARVQLLRRSST